MTVIAAVSELDDCLDSTIVKEYVVSPYIDERLMNALVDGGRLQYFPSFPRPYFRIEKQRAYVIQGIVGNDRFRVTFSPSSSDDTERRLREIIQGMPVAETRGRRHD